MARNQQNTQEQVKRQHSCSQPHPPPYSHAHSKLTPIELELLGISVHYLSTHFLAESNNAGFDEKSKICDIEENVIKRKGQGITCPIDNRLDTAYVYCLAHADNVGRSTIILSYVWGDTVGDIINTLTEYCNVTGEDPKRTYVWIYCLCINQHRVPVEQGILQKVVPSDEFRSVIEGRICKIGHVLAIMTPWQAPTCLTKLRCVFELYTAHEKNCKVTLGMPSRERNNFIDGILCDNGHEKIYKLIVTLSDMDVRKAEAFIESDRAQMLTLVEQGAGYDEFNVRVSNLVKKWMFDVVLGEVEAGAGDYANAASKVRQGTLLNNAAELFYHLHNYDVCLAMGKGALRIFEPIYGWENKLISTSLDLIGASLYEKGDIDEAMKIQDELLVIRKNIFGRDHYMTACTCQEIANCLNLKGKKEEALEMHKEALVILKTIFLEAHEETAILLNQIANMLKKRGEYDEALKLSEEALEIDEKLFGRQHIKTSVTICNVALTHNSNPKGDKEKALEMHKEVLAIYRKVLGKEHEDTASSLNQIAIMLNQTGEYNEALKLYGEALEIKEKLFGRQHVKTADTIHAIAAILYRKGSYKESLKLFKEILPIRDKVHGSNHNRTLNVRNWITLLSNKIDGKGIWQTRYKNG